MTTPAPEPDPYAAGRDPRWDVPPGVPGWSMGQDWNTGPLYEDTGWHIDLSDVSWAGHAPSDGVAENSASPGAAFRYGNEVAPDRAGQDQTAESGQPDDPPGRVADPPPAARSDRPPGRHARRGRPDEPLAGPAVRPGMQTYRSPATTQGAEPAWAEPAWAEPAWAEPRRAWPPGARPGDVLPPAGQPPGGQPPAGQPPRVLPPVGQPLGDQRSGSQPPATSPLSDGARPRRPPADGSAAPSIVRSSRVMAVGTLGSRLTGFLRTIAQSYALGAAGIATAYNLANTLPNVVYNLALGGILTSVIVPLIVNASKRDYDGGEGYDQRMFTLITAALFGITLIATLAADPLVHLYSGTKITGSPAELHLTMIFAYFFIPQIFFYGVSSLIGAVLNSRGSFAAPMWTPIVNNVVVIGVLALYVIVAGLHQNPPISGGDVGLLGLGTTLGIIAQTAALVPALRRVGFRWHPRLDFRRAEVTEIGRMAGWMFGYIAATQVAFLVTTKVASDASLSGVTDYSYAWLLFQLPYAVVGISVITALLPRMSAHASDGRLGLVRADFSTGIRLASVIVVPCSLVLAVLGPKLAELFLGHGATTQAEADYIGVVFAVFCLGLLPYMIFQLQLRVFYSMHDSKTPALIGLATMTVNIVANLIALTVLPADEVVAGLGVGFGLANVLGAVLAWRILSRRLRGLDGWLIGRSLVRMYAATVPAALLAVVVGMITGNAIAVVIIGGGLATAMYVVFARALHIEELTSLSRTVPARIGR